MVSLRRSDECPRRCSYSNLVRSGLNPAALDLPAEIPHAERPQELLVAPNSPEHDLSNSVTLLPQWLMPELSPHWTPAGIVVTYPKETEEA